MKTEAPQVERRATPRVAEDKWLTALTHIEPNKILLRGYALDEIMGRLTFGESIYLLLMGEIPSPGIGRLMEAMLVSFIDHGATPPSTLAARNTATTGCPAARVRGCGAARIRALSRRRHRELHAVPRYRARVRAERLDLSGRRRASGAAEPRGRRDCPRGSATAITLAIRGRRVSSRWPSSSRSKAITSR